MGMGTNSPDKMCYGTAEANTRMQIAVKQHGHLGARQTVLLRFIDLQVTPLVTAAM